MQCFNQLWGDNMDNELKEDSVVDNSKLEELMKQDLTPEMQSGFFEILKESQLFMPVVYSENIFEGIENMEEGDVFQPKEQVGFNINYLTDKDGNRILPLFTSSEIMESIGLESSVYVLYMSDLAEMLKQTDNYAFISINPLTSFDINMSVEAFLNLFMEENEYIKILKDMLKLLKDASVELEENYNFFLRTDDDFMKENAVDGVFTPAIPFNISTREDFNDDLKYLNVLILPEGAKILFLGDIVEENQFDTVIAPGTEFKFVEDLNDFTRVWVCGAQPFYDE